MTLQRFGSGHGVRRIEDPALLSGRGQFTDDVQAADQAVLVFLRSPYAHARILSMDTNAAEAAPGVLAVLTGAALQAAGVSPFKLAVPFPQADGSPAAAPPHPALAVDTVHYVGQTVAAVVARTRLEALDAIELIEIDYDSLPAVADVHSALAPGAPQVWAAAKGNVASAIQHGDAAVVAQAFARAAHRVALTIHNQRLSGAPLEPRVVSAGIDAATGRLSMRLSSQMPTAVRGALAASLGMPVEQIRVQVGDVGGGFGVKTGAYAEDVVVAFAARLLKGRIGSVKWTGDRSEDFLSSRPGRDLYSEAELALDAEGRILALRARSLADVGACASDGGVFIQLLIGPWVTTSIYAVPAIHLDIKAVLTNTVPTGPYRGAGRPEAIYTMERLLDRAARQMKMDPAEIRRRNLLKPEAFPYTNPMAQTYDVGNFPKVFEAGIQQADWLGFDARAAVSKAKGLLRGRSVASFLEWTGGNALEESVTVNVLPEGEIELVSATMPMGQGIMTSYVQLAVDVFDVPVEKIRIVQGDTDRANGFGSAGSRSLFTGGSALHSAAVKTVEHGKTLAADALEAAAADIEYRAGEYRIAGTDRAVSLFDLAGQQQTRRIVVDATTQAHGPTWPNACHVCEVEIDPQTGAVDIASYSSVNDVGRVVNPLIVIGQIEGGAMQGIGQALCEEMVYDRESGQLLTGSFMDYAMPRAHTARNFFTTTMDESTPSTNNDLGVKGVGELGTIGATPAVVNAVLDALRRAGVGDAKLDGLQMPLTAQKVWGALKGA